MTSFKIRIATIAAAVLTAFAAVSVPALAAAAAQAPALNKLEAIDVQTLSDQQVQLKLRMSGPAPQPLSFTIDKPARIALDLPDTALALASRRIDVRSGGVDTVLAAEAGRRTRIVVDLDSMIPYTTKVEGNVILVTLGVRPGEAAAPTAMPAAATAATAAPAEGAGAQSTEHAIRTIDFRRGPDGTGRVIVRLSDPRIPVNVRQEGNQIIVDFAGALLPQKLMRKYDVTDFATPVRSVEALRIDGSSRLVISAQGDFDQLAYQSDREYVVEIKPSAKLAGQAGNKQYTGERLTLDFQNIDVRSVLQLLADTGGQNIVVMDSVTGNLTLRLQNVPWDQALDIVLRAKGLDKRREGNVIIVGPTAELAAHEKTQLSARNQLQALEPLHTEYLQVNYAKASDLANLIKASGGAKNSMLSPRGSLSIDERTNTLLVQDTADRLASIRRLVQKLDVPVKQVLIEARIVVVTDTFERDLGARLGLTTAQQNGSNGLLAVTGNSVGASTMTNSATTNLNTTGSLFPVTAPVLTDRYQVNLPVANPAGTIGLSLLAGSNLVDLELSAAQNEGRGEVISSPRVITANQKEATIMQGVEIPYQQSASSGATTTQFKNAVLSLKVTPLITPDNRVILDIDVSDDSVGSLVQSATGGTVPSINTRRIVTQVLVNDGQTVVLGGILETTKTKSADKVPYLGDIPILGHLFKTTTHVNNKSELLIFITPKILREGSNLY
ncbi:MAG TPA: type IV pilus secretin PilQ [Steroidobacteraceae bacterium]|nr:type IV pilus secretin PilQ [Steroidobacteraceae bacterium]